MEKQTNKSILETGNAAIDKGDYEGFLSFCTEDTKWVFVGDITLQGKQAVRQWITENYLEPPKNKVTNLIAEGDFVTATGEISMKEKDGTWSENYYCDVWRFKDGKMAELKAFVIKFNP